MLVVIIFKKIKINKRVIEEVVYSTYVNELVAQGTFFIKKNGEQSYGYKLLATLD